MLCCLETEIPRIVLDKAKRAHVYPQMRQRIEIPIALPSYVESSLSVEDSSHLRKCILPLSLI